MPGEVPGDPLGGVKKFVNDVDLADSTSAVELAFVNDVHNTRATVPTSYSVIGANVANIPSIDGLVNPSEISILKTSALVLTKFKTYCLFVASVFSVTDSNDEDSPV
jgi:hypothetical protein